MFGINCYSHGLINKFTIFNLISTLCSWVLSGDFLPISRVEFQPHSQSKRDHLFPNNMSDFSQLRKEKKNSTFFLETTTTYDLFVCFVALRPKSTALVMAIYGYLSVTSHTNCIAARCLINVVYLTACCLYQVMMTLHFLNDVANDAESTQK